MSRIVEINSSEDENYLIANNTRVLIFFGSLRCPHCVNIEPTYQKLSKQYTNVVFAHVETTRVSVDNLSGVPAFIAYKNHNYVGSVVGAREGALVEMIETKLL